MNDKIGNITYYDSSGQSDYNFTKPYSEKTAQTIDEEISRIIENQYQRAIAILNKHKEELTELAEILMEKEVIFEDNLIKIFGERPFKKELPIEELKRIDEKKKAKKKEEEKTEEKLTEKKDNSKDEKSKEASK